MEKRQVMHQTRGKSHHQVYKFCTVVSAIMALGLTCVACFTLYRFSSFDNNDWKENHFELSNAYAYYDTNRDAGAILAIRGVSGNASNCLGITASTQANEGFGVDGNGVAKKSQWELVKTLYTLPRYAAGCVNAGKVQLGACTGNLSNVGTPISAHPAVDVGQWEGKMFCVLRTAGSQWQEKNSTACSTATGYTLDSGNHCYKVPGGWTGGAPITQWRISNALIWANMSGAGWTNYTTYTDRWGVSNAMLQQARQRTQWYSNTNPGTNSPVAVGIDVEFYGTNCVNPKRTPLDPPVPKHYVLQHQVAVDGCGSLGADSLSEKAASLNEYAFLQGQLNNSALNLSARNTLFQTTLSNVNFTVDLVNRRRILAQNTAICDSFRFDSAGSQATNVLTQYDQIWSSMQWIAIVSLSASFLSVMMVLLVVMDGYRKQTQNYMVMLYCVCLIGLFVCVVMVWKVKYQVDGDYANARKYFTERADCIVPGEWSNVLSLWIKHTSFSDLSTQLLSTLVVFVTFLLVGVIFAVWALMLLARIRDNREF